jgi:hypothetical protein
MLKFFQKLDKDQRLVFFNFFVEHFLDYGRKPIQVGDLLLQARFVSLNDEFAEQI